MWDWNSSWYLHTVILKLTHLLHYAGAAGELFPSWRGRLETTVWIFFFFACKLICRNPVPSQPYCTGSAVLWVRSIFQVGDIWAAGVWLFIQTEHVGGMKSGSLLEVDGVLYPLHFFKMQWVYCLHLSLLYTYFRAWLFVWLSFYISRDFKQNTNTNMFFWMLFIRFFNCGKLFNCLTGFF